MLIISKPPQNAIRWRIFSWSRLLVGALAIFISTASAQLVPPDADDGKTVIVYPDEPFRNFSATDNGISFVKFSIILNDPGTVYFQDSEKYLFHYEFATARLQPFLGISRVDFDQISLRDASQQVVLGAVLFAPDAGRREIGIQFVGLDPYPREQIAQWFTTVRAAINVPDGIAPTIFYMPTFEQRGVAESEREWLQSQGVTVGGAERWITGDQAYSAGWALGRLVFIPGNEIDGAYADGRLTHRDIVLTDGVPVEMPFLAGIISLSAATPNSHVAILARNQGIPFAHIGAAEKQSRLQTFVGREILFRVRANGFGSQVLFSPVDANLDPGLRAKLLAFKQPERARIPRRLTLGRISSDVTSLTPRDISYFGGKAANFGLLRRTIPENSPAAMAFSFDLWTDFLANTNPESGLTLREEIDRRLGGYEWPPNIAEARLRLEEIRQLIRKKVVFSDAQKEAIIAALLGAGFDPQREVRFRSSTNVEDTSLIGAGLYESFSGCIADSIDGDQNGPSRCCPDEVEEETILGAIEKVFASFYSDNAWLERLRHGVREKHAGMAILAHHNFPDEDELANGVATFTRKVHANDGVGSGSRVSHEAKIVTQAGALSVTNPPTGIKAEVVVGAQDGGNPFFFTEQYSTLVPLGGHAMTWEADYNELFRLLRRVADGYAAMFPAKQEFTLDFEFKRMRTASLEATLIVKQVREIVVPELREVAPFLLNEPADFVVFQGESGDAFAYHRLKSLLHLNTENLRLTPAKLARGVHKQSAIQFPTGEALQELRNGPAAWPSYRYVFSDDAAVDRWVVENNGTRTRFILRTILLVEASAQRELVFTQRDFEHRFSAIYASAQPFIDFDGVKTRRSDSVTVVPRDSLPPMDTPITRRISHPAGVNIETTFFWPKYEGFVIIKTSPLAAWVETRISGLTTEPLVLKSEFAQTYAPGHHNFFERFIFEPRLDPNVNAAQRAELRARNVQLIHVNHDAFGGGDTWHFLGSDGVFRDAP